MLGNLFSNITSRLNFTYKPEKQPNVIGDYLAWKIGWAEEDIKRGDAIHLRRSDAKHLIKLLSEFVE